MSPSSPGVKASVEQNPSVEDISRVKPSLDLFVLAKHRLPLDENIPCQVGERRKMEIAHDAQWCQLLGIINKDSVLCCNCIDHAIGQGEC